VSQSAQGVALGYEPSANPDGEPIWIPIGGAHRAEGLSDPQRRRLVGAVLAVRPELGTRLVLLGADVDGLRPEERVDLRDRIAFLPADGGLLSSLNAWENIVLPIGFHHPKRLRGVAAQVHELLEAFGADSRDLLAKLPERMSLYERKLTGYVRIVLEKPDLMLVEESEGDLDSAVYLETCPGGTFVRLGVARGL
jgi:ABC-type transporter Mla maintaining outer membrane lipid asymmetry ATPase subunit MlaF